MCYEKNAFNVLNTELKACSTDPLTGFYRDGHCKTFNNDVGGVRHVHSHLNH